MNIKLDQIDSLERVIDLEKNMALVVVGAGGKTSFCLELAEELKNEGVVIFTTTTKIYVPESKRDCKVYIGSEFLKKVKLENGIYVVGKSKNNENKLLPYSLENIAELKEKCDYLIIEGDGSKMKPLKGWNENEPVFIRNTDKTIGILNIKTLNLKIDENNIHRIDKFLDITKADLGGNVSLENLFSIISDKKGLFKDSIGEKILLINQVESQEDINNSIELVKLIKTKKLYLNKIVLTSLLEKKYYLVK